ncbi:NAD-dependent epimerase/dehydratase family protein [Candidatus Fermentibacteria bacterium]|nr:NAD-dependent epimerase/dehydratase family protein [Candidatus Fermentibacteria bacterium]
MAERSDSSRLGGPVLVTGAAGFVGGHLMRKLSLGEGDYATDIDDRFQAPPGVTRLAWRLPGDPPPGLGEVGCVVHLAAVSSVRRSLEGMRSTWETNLMGTLAVLDYMVRKIPEARLLLVSSSEVYRPSEDVLTEESPLGPVNPYGATKAAAERAAFQYASVHGLDVVVARSFPHFGPGQSSDFALPAFCRRIVRAERNGEDGVRVGNLEAVRDYLYVDDVVRAYEELITEGRPGSAYNVCSGSGSSMGQILEILLDLAEADLEIEKDPDLFRPVDVRCQVGDPSRLRSLSGWSPGVSLRGGLGMLLDYWRERE